MDVCLQADRPITVGVTAARARFDGPRCASCRERLPRAVAATPATEGETSAPHLNRDLPPPTRFGRYVFAGEIGAGGMGVVYAAHDPELDRMVAVKLLRGDGDARLQERLRREAQTMARLAHPNVVGVYDVGTFEDRVFIAMEYVEGETLAQWSARPRTQREILAAYCAAARGLAAAHAAGIVHRDFKPDNVLVGDDGRVRVGDFGLARPAGIAGARPSARVRHSDRSDPARHARGSAPAALTAPGALVGTRYYMAPELYKGVEADVRSDQFSFCVALFTALYGERPFDVDTSDALDACTLRLRGPHLGSRVARRVRAALRRGLAADPAARFSSLDELLAELESSPRRRLGWAIGAVVALAVIAIRIGHPSAAPATCGPAPDPPTAWWTQERADGGKPTAEALHDPATALDRATPAIDPAVCPPPRVPGDR